MNIKVYLATRGITLRELLKGCGWSETHVNKCINRGPMSQELYDHLMKITEGKVNFKFKPPEICPKCGRREKAQYAALVRKRKKEDIVAPISGD